MACVAVRTGLTRWAGGVALAVAALGGQATSMSTAPAVQADTVAYLINVTVRPGYNFATADAALTYGHGICQQVTAGRAYADVLRDIEADFATSDEYQASYLIIQAVNELCPAQIWNLRSAAAHHRPGVQ